MSLIEHGFSNEFLYEKLVRLYDSLQKAKLISSYIELSDPISGFSFKFFWGKLVR